LTPLGGPRGEKDKGSRLNQGGGGTSEGEWGVKGGDVVGGNIPITAGNTKGMRN